MATKKRVTKKKRVTRKKRKVNKSQAVREYLATNPDAGPKEVCDALAKNGITVSPAQVSNIKSAKRKKKKKGGRKGLKRAAATSGTVAVQDLLSAKQFASSVGGVDHARELLAALDRLNR